MRIGIDLGGTTVKAALCGEDGAILRRVRIPTPTGDANALRAGMKRMALGLCAEQGIAPAQVMSIGLGVPGSFEKASCALRHQSGHERRVLRADIRAGVCLPGLSG